MINERFAISDKISFYCNGRNRGGHFTAHCEVRKINRKTVLLEEVSTSYKPGQQWQVNVEWLLENLTPKSMTLPGYNEKISRVW